jgi:ribokinase
VLVVGSINADWVVPVPRLPAPGETVLGGDVEHHHGGKSSNQAAAAARAGAEVLFVGAVGDDAGGERELDALTSEGVDVSGVARIAGVATGIAVITVAPDGENQIVVAAGANARLDGAWVTAALSRHRPRAGDVVLACHEVGDEAIEAAFAIARQAGATAILNPAPARAIAPAVLAQRPILTPNEPEARALAGCADVAEAARTLRASTGAAVVVTLGAAGVALLDGAGPDAEVADGALVTLPAPACTPLDTTGAGDVFNGVLAARLAAGDDRRAAATIAVAEATRSTQWPGARPPRAWGAETF